MAVTGTMEIGEGNEHLEVIHISLQISRQNEQNLKSTNIRSIRIYTIQQSIWYRKRVVYIFLNLGFNFHLEYRQYKFRSLP
jgi:hypothetical protein